MVRVPIGFQDPDSGVAIIWHGLGLLAHKQPREH